MGMENICKNMNFIIRENCEIRYRDQKILTNILLTNFCGALLKHESSCCEVV